MGWSVGVYPLLDLFLIANLSQYLSLSFALYRLFLSKIRFVNGRLIDNLSHTICMRGSKYEG